MTRKGPPQARRERLWMSCSEIARICVQCSLLNPRIISCVTLYSVAYATPRSLLVEQLFIGLMSSLLNETLLSYNNQITRPYS